MNFNDSLITNKYRPVFGHIKGHIITRKKLQIWSLVFQFHDSVHHKSMNKIPT